MRLVLPQVSVVQSGGSSFLLWFTLEGMLVATVAFLYPATSEQSGQDHHYVSRPVITLSAAVWYMVTVAGHPSRRASTWWRAVLLRPLYRLGNNNVVAASRAYLRSRWEAVSGGLLRWWAASSSPTC